MTLEETLQTMFYELKFSLNIGLNARQSSLVLWIEKQLWCCGAAVSACAVQLERNQTKYSGTNRTQQNKCLCLSSWMKLLMHLWASNDSWQKWSGHLTECKGGGPDSAALNEVLAMMYILEVLADLKNRFKCMSASFSRHCWCWSASPTCSATCW